MKKSSNWATNMAQSFYEEYKKEIRTNYWWLLLLILVAGYLLAPTLVARLNLTPTVAKQLVGVIQIVTGFGSIIGPIIMWIETDYLNATIKEGAAKNLINKFVEAHHYLGVPPVESGKDGHALFLSLWADDFVSPLSGRENEEFLAWVNIGRKQ